MTAESNATSQDNEEIESTESTSYQFEMRLAGDAHHPNSVPERRVITECDIPELSDIWSPEDQIQLFSIGLDALTHRDYLYSKSGNSQTWLVWNGHHWTDGFALACLTEDIAKITPWMVEQYLRVHASEGESERRKLLRKVRSPYSVGQLLALFRDRAGAFRQLPSGPELRTFHFKPGDLDCAPDLLLLPEGEVLNLADGTVEPNTKAALLASPTQVRFDRTAQAPSKFLDGLRHTFSNCDDVDDMIEFVQRVFGTCLLPESPSRFFAFLYGGPGTGKSTMVNILEQILSPTLTYHAQEQLITGSASESRFEKGNLPGVRMVVIPELSHRLDIRRQGLLKAITGGDSITGEAKFMNAFTFAPVMTLLMTGNSLPSVTADAAFFERAHVIPFEVKVEAADSSYVRRVVAAEGPQILAWLAEGARRYIHEGRQIRRIPETVQAATRRWRNNVDVVEQFFDEKVLAVPDDVRKPLQLTARDAAISRRELYLQFKSFQTQALGSAKAWQRGAFMDALDARGLVFMNYSGNYYLPGHVLRAKASPQLLAALGQVSSTAAGEIETVIDDDPFAL